MIFENVQFLNESRSVTILTVKKLLIEDFLKVMLLEDSNIY